MILKNHTTKINSRHGDYKTKLYSSWKCMKRRCYLKTNKRFKHYGGRGISVCEEWHVYENFKAWAVHNGYQEGLTIGRKNNNGNYDPNNCRWENVYDQANNTSRSHFIKHEDKNMTIAQWARFLKLTYNQVNCSLFRGYTIKEIIDGKPKFKTRSNNHGPMEF